MMNRKILGLVLALCLVLVMPVAAMALTLDATGTTTLQGNDAISGGKLTFTSDHTIDLNNKTLSIESMVLLNANTDVVIKNGTIDIGNMHATGNAIIELLSNATLKLSNVKMIGEGFSSAYCVFYGHKAGSEVIIENSNINLKNDSFSGGGFYKSESNKSAGLTITNSTVTLDKMARGIQGGTVKITDSTVSMTNMYDNTINSAESSYQLDMTIDNSKVSISGDMSSKDSAGLRLGKGSTVKVSNNSSLNVGEYPNDQAFHMRDKATDKPIITVDVTSRFDVKDDYEEAKGYIGFEGEVKIENGQFVVRPISVAVPSTSDLPQTGDSSSIALWLTMLAMSAAAMTMFVRSRKYN